ncbi:MAG: hypothetical protein A2Y76_10710 [Planctomycetes bacterium RBG_13_60_9]|nr:MAG: hypothetical protein A2Y76_10710 [Planctomycetes bacterium RBG_13_60_9]
MEAVGLRKELADLERRLASTTGVPNDVNQLRQRLEKYSEILDLMDRAIYIRAADGGLRLEDRVYHREAFLSPSPSGVRAQWHGDVLDANSITLLHALAPVRTDSRDVPPVGWRSRFDAVYSLADGEILRWVRTPFIPERRYYTRELPYYTDMSKDKRPQPLYLGFHWDGTLHYWTLATSEGVLGSVFAECGLERYERSGPADLVELRLGGDWIVRTNTSIEQRLSALEEILERELGRRIRFQRRSVEREVIVVRGQYERRPLAGHANTEPVYLFAEATPDQSGLRRRESITQMFQKVASRFNRPIILETQGLDEVFVEYQTCLSYDTWVARKLDPKDPFPIHGGEALDPVLANLTKQTSLKFARETRPFNTWFITEIKEPSSGNPSNPSPR